MRDYIVDFVKKENGGPQCVDMLRFYLTQIAPESKDSEFTWKGFQDAVNNELVAIFGNFVNRTWVLMHKLCKGKVPVLHEAILDEDDRLIIDQIQRAKYRVEQLLEEFKFREALFEVIDLSRKGNQYMQKKEPWILAKQLETAPELQQRIDNCMHLCLQLSANLAILIHPFLPNTAKKMLHMMKVVDRMLDWEHAGKIKLLSTGYSLREPQLLFRKVEDEEVTMQIEKLKKGAMEKHTTPDESVTPANAFTPLKDTITIDDFSKIDLRIGTITQATKVEKADKLLQLTVDMGFETRTILSGIALHFAPENIIGKQVVVVSNLAPRKMRGIESNGMILMAEDAQGRLHFVRPEDVIPPGATVS
jgi:methionyl-tRNA synthetase